MIARGIIAMLICTLLSVASPSPVQGLTLLARDMGFTCRVGIIQSDHEYATYNPLTKHIDIAVMTILSDPEFLHAILAHEVEHDKVLQLYLKPNSLLPKIEKLAPLGSIRNEILKYCQDPDAYLVITETFAHIAFLYSLGDLAGIPNEWLRAYYSINSFQEKK